MNNIKIRVGFRLSLLVVCFTVIVFSFSCKEDVLPKDLILTLKVNGVANPDTIIIKQGDSVTFQWICRRGESDLDELSITPFESMVGVYTFNGDLISSSGKFSAEFDTEEIYSDKIKIPVSINTLFYFKLSDVDGNVVENRVLIK